MYLATNFRAGRVAVMAIAAALLLLFFYSGDTARGGGTTIVVTTTEDNLVDLVCNDGDCSLRAALTIAGPGDTINFAITTGCFGDLCGISINSPLPPITDQGLTINGYTQPNAVPNSAGPGQATNAALKVVVNGTNCASCDGFVINADAVTIKGLDIILFGGSGIQVNADATVIEGNWIGPSVLGLDAGNGTGIRMDDASQNLIGGAPNAARNVISGNGDGIVIVGNGLASATQNTISGNFIGTNAAGNVALGNSQRGITLNGATFATIGGDTAQERNVIAGNIGEGVAMIGLSNDNTVSGNYIGTDLTGAVDLENAGGLSIPGNGTRNTIGGDTAAERNVISGNKGVGALIQDSSGNTVSGNYIGTDVTGTAALPNGEVGVMIRHSQAPATGNVIGGNSAGARNIISGNTGVGVVIEGLLASDNVVSGNYIGTDAAGTAPLPNGPTGVSVTGPGNRIGGPPGEGNVISAHATSGISIDASSADGNTVQANYVGLDATGTAAMLNEINAIFIAGGANDTVVGGTSGAGNTIAPGSRAGIRVSFNSGGAVIQGNRIGTNAAGTASLGAAGGSAIEVSSAASIGGAAPGQGNLLSGNTVGIRIGPFDHAGGQTILGNVIGTAADRETPIPNTGYGIQIDALVTSVLIGSTLAGEGNLIAFNQGPAVVVSDADTTGVSVEGNSIHSNDALGIDLGDDGVTANDHLDADSGANSLMNHPGLQAIGPGQLEVSVQGLVNHAFRVTLYTSETCDSARPQGKTYVQTLEVLTDGLGAGSTTVTVPGGLFTALATSESTDETSEFSACESVEPPPGTPTPTLSPTPSVTATPTATPEGQTPSPTAVGQTPTPTPTPTPPGETPSPTNIGQTPTPTSDGDDVVWGDINCSGDADPVDSLLVLRFDAGLSTNTGDCPPLGDGVGVAGVTEWVWGDVDCSGDVNPIDSLKLLRFDAGLSVAQDPGCPEMGGPVSVAVAALPARGRSGFAP